MAQADGHVPELTYALRKCFLREADQSQSAPSHWPQPASLPCSRSRVSSEETAEGYSLFNILLGSKIICTHCPSSALLLNSHLIAFFWIFEITFNSTRANWNVAKTHN